MSATRDPLICGIDEAGRGPIAGPVCAASVILSADFDRSVLRDSKVLSPRARQRIAASLRESVSLIGVGWAWPEEIDSINIHNASLLAMSRSFRSLLQSASNNARVPEIHALVDGKFVPELPVSSAAVVRGDSSVAEISAASIIAKVTRDCWMIRYSWIEPLWEFDRHKGYPTARHRELCRLHGLSPIHRRSFRIY